MDEKAMQPQISSETEASSVNRINRSQLNKVSSDYCLRAWTRGSPQNNWCYWNL